MIAHQVLVKVLRREVPIARPGLLQQPLNLVHWRPPTRGSAAAPVDQALRPLSLVTIPKPADYGIENAPYRVVVSSIQSP